MDIKDYNKEEKKEIIKTFLEGSDEQKYITGIEGDYYSNEVTLMIEDPEKGKYTEKHKFTPFAYVKDFKKLKKQLYKSKEELNNAMKIHGITIKTLRTDSHLRLEYGYKYLLTTSKKLLNIIQFFSKAGYDLFKKEDGNLFIAKSGIEQFLMTTGKRLFKGFDSYDSIHKFYFDIETTGLNPVDNYTFLIGMKDNRGFQKVLTIDLNNPIESEKQMIIDFFQTILDLKPTIVAGYFSESFDFYFLIERAKILRVELGTRKDEDNNWVYDVRTSLNEWYPLKRKNSTFKHGATTEHYEQTIMWGINIIDISHAVKKAAAINSDIKRVGLKYICKFSEIAKENRMYVKDGSRIFKIWEENKNYFINNKNNNYKEIPANFQEHPQEYKNKLKKWVINGNKEGAIEPLKKTSDFFNNDPDNVEIITGKEIIYQYLLDDLSETEMVDNRFNEASFMLGKIAPTSFVRASTMGNASLWGLLLTTYSYHNNLAIPCNDLKRDIVGGLSRLLKVGYAKNIIKFDYTALYPGIELTHGVFPDLDITGVMEAILTYFRDARIEFKTFKDLYKETNSALSKFYDTKQLPIKILTNSNFGAISSPTLFNWGDNNVGERITCTGRQYFRLMFEYFISYGFSPVNSDTDGCNFSMPDNVEENKYTNKEGEELIGYKALLAQFNEKYMKGVMNLEEDGIYAATINFSRKNYVNLTKEGKVKLTGATIKSKTIQTYIEEFFDKGLKLLLNDGNAKRFVEEYYDYISKIYNKQIPLLKIANKKKVNERVADYQWAMENNKNKNGQRPAKKAHMELMIELGLNPELGEVILFINNGKTKSKGDTGNSYYLNLLDLEQDPNKLGEYNVPRYIANFNKRIEPILVCLHPEVRNTLLINNPKDRQFYTDSQLELVMGMPVKADQQDTLYWNEFIPGEHENEPVFEMTEREIKFWNRSGLDPREIFANFTTKLSSTRLLTQEEQKNKTIENDIIKEWFKINRSAVKNETDFLLDKDEVIIFKDNFTTYLPNDDKEKKKSKPWVEEIVKLDNFKWVLSRYEIIKTVTNDGKLIQVGRLNDLEIIDEEIYTPNLILEDTLLK